MSLFKKEKVDEKYVCPELPHGFTVTHHAGALDQKPNTPEAVSYSVYHGAKCIELDVSFRPDGKPVIIHDATPGENQGESLKTALKIIAGSRKCKINLDLKSTKNLPAIDELVQEYNLKERVFYTGVGEDWVSTVKENSSIPYYLNHNITPKEAEDKETCKALCEKIMELGAIGVNSKYGHCSKQLCKMMHRRNLKVSIWTVNKLSQTKELLEYGVDNITTMKPDLLEKQIFGDNKNDSGNLSVLGE